METFTAEQVVNEIKKQIPTEKWVYLWIQPSLTVPRVVENYSLFPPFIGETGWVGAGKIEAKMYRSYVTKYRLIEKLESVIEMSQSYLKIS